MDLGCGYASCRVKTPGQPSLDLDAKLDVIAMFGQRGTEDLLGGMEPLGVSAHPAEPRQRLRPLPTRWRFGDHLLQQFSGAVDLTGVEASLCRLHRSSSSLTPGIRGREAAGLLPQVRGRPGRSSGTGPSGGFVERGCDGEVGAFRRQHQMTPAFLGIVEDLGQASVQAPSPLRRDLRVCDRGEQWMREQQAVAIPFEDSRLDRRLEFILRVSPDCIDERRRRSRQRCDDLRCLTRRWG